MVTILLKFGSLQAQRKPIVESTKKPVITIGLVEIDRNFSTSTMARVTIRTRSSTPRAVARADGKARKVR